MSPSHHSPATAILVVYYCQFGPSWMFGLKMELMTCADLVSVTKKQLCLFPEIIFYYQEYGTIVNCVHHTSAVPQPFLLLIAANLALAGFLN